MHYNLQIHYNNMSNTPTEKTLEALSYLQHYNGEYIDGYIEHLRRIDEILFDIGSQNEIDCTKADIFELLNQNRLLRADLVSLKTE